MVNARQRREWLCCPAGCASSQSPPDPHQVTILTRPPRLLQVSMWMFNTRLRRRAPVRAACRLADACLPPHSRCGFVALAALGRLRLEAAHFILQSAWSRKNHRPLKTSERFCGNTCGTDSRHQCRLMDHGEFFCLFQSEVFSDATLQPTGSTTILNPKEMPSVLLGKASPSMSKILPTILRRSTKSCVGLSNAPGHVLAALIRTGTAFS